MLKFPLFKPVLFVTLFLIDCSTSGQFILRKLIVLRAHMKSQDILSNILVYMWIRRVDNWTHVLLIDYFWILFSLYLWHITEVCVYHHPNNSIIYLSIWCTVNIVTIWSIYMYMYQHIYTVSVTINIVHNSIFTQSLICNDHVITNLWIMKLYVFYEVGHRHDIVTTPSQHVTTPSQHVTGPSQHRHSTVTTPSQHVTTPSQSQHVTTPSQHRHNTVTTPSQPVTTPSQPVTTPSQHRRSTVAAPSQHRHWTCVFLFTYICLTLVWRDII